MVDEKERREKPRLDEHSTIFIQTLAAAHSTEQEAILICSSLDISAEGMCVCVDNQLEAGAILQLGIELPELERPLYVVGEVRWCKPAETPGQGFCVGFQLLESDGTDYQIWKTLIQDLS